MSDRLPLCEKCKKRAAVVNLDGHELCLVCAVEYRKTK